MDQLIIPWLTFFSILITCLLDICNNIAWHCHDLVVRWRHLFSYIKYILLVRHLGFVCVLLYIARSGLLQYCIDIVRRNSVLVTCGSERVKEVPCRILYLFKIWCQGSEQKTIGVQSLLLKEPRSNLILGILALTSRHFSLTL